MIFTPLPQKIGTFYLSGRKCYNNTTFPLSVSPPTLFTILLMVCGNGLFFKTSSTSKIGRNETSLVRMFRQERAPSNTVRSSLGINMVLIRYNIQINAIKQFFLHVKSLFEMYCICHNQNQIQYRTCISIKFIFLRFSFGHFGCIHYSPVVNITQAQNY